VEFISSGAPSPGELVPKLAVSRIELLAGADPTDYFQIANIEPEWKERLEKRASALALERCCRSFETQEADPVGKPGRNHPGHSGHFTKAHSRRIAIALRVPD